MVKHKIVFFGGLLILLIMFFYLNNNFSLSSSARDNSTVEVLIYNGTGVMQSSVEA